MPLTRVALDALTIEDEASFTHVALYARLKRALRGSEQRFLIPEDGTELSWDRAVFLNLTYWSGGADVLCEPSIAADVVAHVAWHHLAARELAAAVPCAQSLFFGESIASAFDMYLVGRLLPNVPDSDFISTQVPIMREAAEEAGMGQTQFEALLQFVCDQPEQAFEALRALLLDAASGLYACTGAEQAQALLERLADHRFAPLLHHYQLSNWVLYARAYAAVDPAQGARVAQLDAQLRTAGDSLRWLAAHWLPE